MGFEEDRKELVEVLERRGYIKTKKVKKAMEKVPREIFLPEHNREYAYMDTPQPIGQGQTISAPHMVAMMIEALDLEEGQKVLEVGGGRGYHAAVISEIIGDKGEVYTVELLESLGNSAKKALSEAGYDNVHVVIGDGSKGYKKESPFDRISVACGAPSIPSPMIKQLKEGGKILIPVGGSMYQELIKATKVKKGKIKKEELGGVVFVPLKGEYGH